jgi:putative ABC transport system permease protein
MPGVSHDDVRSAVNAMLAQSDAVELGPFYVLDPVSFLHGVRSAVQKFFAATWALEFVAALVGVIGVVNTQLATVLDRKAEIGVLRTIGVSRKDIVRSVVIECGALGALGGILGVALGLVLGAQIVLVSLKLVTGWSMAFHVPWAQLGAGIVIATIVSAVAGYVPARAAARVQLGQRSVD